MAHPCQDPLGIADYVDCLKNAHTHSASKTCPWGIDQPSMQRWPSDWAAALATIKRPSLLNRLPSRLNNWNLTLLSLSNGQSLGPGGPPTGAFSLKFRIVRGKQSRRPTVSSKAWLPYPQVVALRLSGGAEHRSAPPRQRWKRQLISRAR